MGGIWDVLFGGTGSELAQGSSDADYSACSAQADQDTATIDTQAYDLAKNWNPTGVYTPDQMDTVIARVLDIRQSAYNALSQAVTIAPSTQQDLVNQMRSNLTQSTGQLLDYQAAVTAGRASGQPIMAPGFKQWVLDNFTDASSAVHAGSVIACQMPWWSAALIAVSTAAVALAGAAKAVVGVVIAAGEKSVRAIEAGIDMIATIEEIAPYALVGLAAWWLFLRDKRQRARSRAS